MPKMNFALQVTYPEELTDEQGKQIAIVVEEDLKPTARVLQALLIVLVDPRIKVELLS